MTKPHPDLLAMSLSSSRTARALSCAARVSGGPAGDISEEGLPPPSHGASLPGKKEKVTLKSGDRFQEFEKVKNGHSLSGKFRNLSAPCWAIRSRPIKKVYCGRNIDPTRQRGDFSVPKQFPGRRLKIQRTAPIVSFINARGKTACGLCRK